MMRHVTQLLLFVDQPIQTVTVYSSVLNCACCLFLISLSGRFVMASLYLIVAFSVLPMIYCDLPTVWMNDNCQTSQLKYYEFDDAIRLKANSFYPGTCKFTVAVSRSNHVIARFRSLDTPRKSSGVCKKFKLDIFDGPTADETKRLSGNSICGSHKPSHNFYLTASNYMTFYAHVPGQNIQTAQFEIIITRAHNDIKLFSGLPGTTVVIRLGCEGICDQTTP
ncbi:hypothetical protein ScPMuIL_000764 [Solemya velum]